MTSAPTFDIDRSSPTPLYFQLARAIEGAITGGALPAGARLGNESLLAQRYGLSRPTVRRAVQELVDKGLLVRKRGVGTQVIQPHVRRSVELTSLYDDLAKTGRNPSTTVVSFGIEPAPDPIAAKLGIPAGAPVYVFERLRYADAEPLALMRNHVPEHLLRLTAADLETQGLYNMFRASGVSMRIAKQSIGARAATPAEARLKADLDAKRAAQPAGA